MKLKPLIGSATLLLFLSTACEENKSNSEDQKDDTQQEMQQNQNMQQDQNMQQGQQGQQGAQMQNPQQMPQTPPGANIEVSDAELKKFYDVAMKIQVLSEKTRGEMITALESEGLDVERFNEMQQGMENPEQDLDVSDEDMLKYESSIAKLQDIQKDAEEKMKLEMTTNGIEESRYQEIGMALQSNPELQKKFQELQQNSQNK